MTWLGKYSCIIGMLQHSRISNFIVALGGVNCIHAYLYMLLYRQGEFQSDKGQEDGLIN